MSMGHNCVLQIVSKFRQLNILIIIICLVVDPLKKKSRYLHSFAPNYKYKINIALIYIDLFTIHSFFPEFDSFSFFRENT